MICQKALKKFLRLMLVPSFSIAALSCTQNTVSASEGYETLKEEAVQKESLLTWTQELEGTILTEKIQGADGLEKSLASSGSNIFASGSEAEYPPIYPQIEGFSSLDISAMEDSVRTLLKGFCNSIISKSDSDSFFKKDSLYTLVLFRYDLSFQYNTSYPAFKGFILGEPFINENVYQCPIRFTEKSGKHTDVCAYLEKEGGVYKISALTITSGESK